MKIVDPVRLMWFAMIVVLLLVMNSMGDTIAQQRKLIHEMYSNPACMTGRMGEL